MALVLIPILAQALFVSAGDRSEVSLRNTQDESYLDVVTQGQLGLAVLTRRSTWRLSYSPTLSQYDLGGATSSLLILHTGTFSANLRLTPRTSVFVMEEGSYGERSMRLMPLVTPQSSGYYTAGAAADTPTGGANTSGGVGAQAGLGPQVTVPVPRTILYGSTTGTVAVTNQLNSRWQTLARLGYHVSGGLDQVSRSFMPRLETVSSGVALSHAATRRDQVVLGLDAFRSNTRAEFVEREAAVASADITWRHQSGRTLSAELSAGVAFARVTTFARSPFRPEFPLPSVPSYDPALSNTHEADNFVVPTGSLNLSSTHRWQRGRLQLGFAQSIYPYVDRMTGLVSPRSVTQVRAAWTRRRLTVGGTGEVATSLLSEREGSALRRLYNFHQFLEYALRPHWTFQTGLRETLFDFANVDTTVVWIAYAAASYTTGDVSP